MDHLISRDPRVPKGLQDIQTDITSNTKDVPIDKLDQVPNPLDPRIPTSLQGTDEQTLGQEKSYLETAKDKISGTYESVKDKASELMGSGQKMGEQVKSYGQEAQKKLENMTDRHDVRVGEMEKVQHPQDTGMPTTLQGTDHHTSVEQKGLLESAKDKLTGTYETIKDKASDLVYGHHEKTVGEKAQELGDATRQKFDEMNEQSKEYLDTAGDKMKSAGDYLQSKAHDKNSCQDTAEAIKHYAEISADKVADMCEASKEYMDAAGGKMKDAGDYIQKHS